MFRQLFKLCNILIIIIIIGLDSAVTAQNLTRYEWQAGEVILTTGDTLTGAVSYYLNKELIQVKGSGNLVKTFSPVNVTRFRVFNEQKQVFQTFRPFMYTPNPAEPAFKTPTFFEVITEGKYTLIKKSNYVIRNLDPLPAYTTLGRFYEPKLVRQKEESLNNYQIVSLNVFYLLTPQNEIIPLRHPKKNMEQLYQEKSAPMKAFIRRKNLSYKNPVALTHLVQYFNHL